MPTFEYQGLNNEGSRVTGTVLSGTMEQALTSLSESGLVIERINQSVLLDDPIPSQTVTPPVQQVPIAPPPVIPNTAQSEYGIPPPPVSPMVEGPPIEQRNYMATSVVGPLVGSVPLKNLAFFYRQFATMIEAGVPMVQALDTLKNQGSNPKFHHVVNEIKGHVEAGRPVSAGMQRYPEVFAPLTVSLVRAGEEGGFLGQSFRLLADYTDQEIKMKNLIRRLTLYPKIVLVSSIILIAGANGIIHMLGKESNLLTSPLTEWGIWLILGPLLIGAFLFYRIGLANPRIKFNWDMLLVKTPFGVGKTVHEFAMSKFGTALAFLYKGGVPVQNAINLAADACGNEYVRAQIKPASRRLESGAGITDTLRSTNAFSPIVMDMVDTGEHTGNLDLMLLKMSSFYEDEAETRAKQIAQIFSTILYVLVAVYVLYVLITFYTKLYAGVGAAGSDASGD